jgi:hypothetical protein
MDVTFDTTIGDASCTSYATIDEFKTYWFNEAYDYGALSDTDIKRLLNKASKYIDNNYRKSFPGYRQYDDQSMEFPRSSAYYLDGFSIDEDTIPPEVISAVCEASYLSNSGEDLTATISNGKVKSSKVKVDVIEEEIEYESGSSLYTDIFSTIDEVLSRLTGGVSDRFVLRIIRTGGESP